MIRIVDEEEVRALVPGKVGLREDERDLLAEIRLLKGLLAEKDQALERAGSGDPAALAVATGYRAKIDVLRKETEERDQEIVRLRDRHERDVGIIAGLKEEIDALKLSIASLETQLGEALARADRVTQRAGGPGVVHVSQSPSGVADVQEAELLAFPQQGYDVEARPLHRRHPDEDGEVLGAVVIPLSDESEAITPMRPVKYRPLD